MRCFEFLRSWQIKSKIHWDPKLGRQTDKGTKTQNVIIIYNKVGKGCCCFKLTIFTEPTYVHNINKRWWAEVHIHITSPPFRKTKN